MRGQKRVGDDLTTQEREVVRLIKSGVTAANVGRDLGIPRNAMSGMIYRLRERGFLERHPKKKPVTVIASTLTAEQRVAIRAITKRVRDKAIMIEKAKPKEERAKIPELEVKPVEVKVENMEFDRTRRGRSIMDGLKRTHCRWVLPHRNGRGDSLFCCEPTHSYVRKVRMDGGIFNQHVHSHFCEHHYRRAYMQHEYVKQDLFVFKMTKPRTQLETS